MKQELSGGRKGAIYRQNNTVIRPLNRWSTTVHLLLNHLQVRGVTECPKFITIEGETEILSFIDGDSFNYPLLGAIASDTALISAARLLRKLHDASSNFLLSVQADDLNWMLPSIEPQEVICHGDFTPYNVSLQGEQVVGVFDFDTAHPAPRVWDLAYSIYCWAPFKTNSVDALGTLTQQINRAKLFCDAYGASIEQRHILVDTMIQRLHALVSFMENEAKSGNQQFIHNIEQGHHLSYLADIEYLKLHHKTISQNVHPLSQTQPPIT
ncbi:MAG: aminoglycoside phosphotransferase family protein [Aliivibrio sp.]|nr:aminoglycoside phosphotransferase family protein [Aliivibrio sp.]